MTDPSDPRGESRSREWSSGDRSSGDGPRSIGDLMGGFGPRRELGERLERGKRDAIQSVLGVARGAAKRSELTRALHTALGEQAEFCRVRGLRAGVLTIEVDSAPLYAELRGFRSEDVREAINRALSVAKVAKIRFRMGGTGHV